MTHEIARLMLYKRRWYITSYVTIILILFSPGNSIAGGACAVAKELGNSLAIDWVANTNDTASNAINKSKTMLRNKGFTKKKLLDLHIQASTSLAHGHLIIIKTAYKTWRGKTRTSYGCGFSQKSTVQAKQRALTNLRSYSWEWKPEFGFELHTRHNF